MERKSFLKGTAILLTAFAIGGKNSFAQLLAENGYDIKMIGENVGIFTEKGGTIMFVHTSEGTVVIDTQFPDSAAHLIDEFKKMKKGIAMVTQRVVPLGSGSTSVYRTRINHSPAGLCATYFRQ